MISRRDTYLSIDLDYWTACPEDVGGLEQADIAASDFLRRARAWAPSMVLCTDHDQIVPHINGVHASPIRRVINVDYHSDLPDWGVDSSFPELNEGTWGLYVAMPHTKTFEWRSASDRHMPYRRCTSSPDNPAWDPFLVEDLTPYRKAVHTIGLEGIDPRTIAAVGVCVSPSWWGSDTRIDTSWNQAMPRTRRLLKLREWPDPSSRMFRVLKGEPVMDPGFQKRIFKAFKAVTRR